MRHNTQLIPAAVTALFVLIAIAGTAIAGPIEDGEAARDRKDYATALRLFRSLAEQGDATAQEHLGVMYENGMPKRCTGFAVLLTRALRQRSGFSERCIRPGTACSRTTSKHTCGTICQPRRVGEQRRKIGRC
jgi:hypothetical protein